jgi:hypothetical protein
MELKGYNFKELNFEEDGSVNVSVDIICHLKDGSVTGDININYVYTIPAKLTQPIVDDITMAVQNRFEQLKTGK